jgi:hypothetical protein
MGENRLNRGWQAVFSASRRVRYTPNNSLPVEMAARLGVGLAGLKAPALPDNRAVLKDPDTTPCNGLLAEMAAWRQAIALAPVAQGAARIARHDLMQLSAGGPGGCTEGAVVAGRARWLRLDLHPRRFAARPLPGRAGEV